MDWKSVLQGRASEVLGRVRQDAEELAKALLADLEANGSTVEVQPDGKLKVAGNALTTELRNRIKASKEKLADLLTGRYTPIVQQPARFTADSMKIELLIGDKHQGGIIGPAHPEHPQIGAKLHSELETIFLDNLQPVELADIVRQLGGLKIYTVTQWQTIKTELDGVLNKC